MLSLIVEIMKKLTIYLFVSIVLAVVLSLYTRALMTGDVLDTLYTVAGVIFSVGMSLTVSPKTDGVVNETIKKSIRYSYKKIRNSFMSFFCIDTVLYVLTEFDFSMCLAAIWGNCCAIFLLFSIGYYVCNFNCLQMLGEKIEDHAMKENNL
nr:MAG TPA: protein of unknown function (DUF5392) [Bacteriophage sp.]